VEVPEINANLCSNKSGVISVGSFVPSLAKTDPSYAKMSKMH
jgi:hypothetical protein